MLTNAHDYLPSQGPELSSHDPTQKDGEPLKIPEEQDESQPMVDDRKKGYRPSQKEPVAGPGPDPDPGANRRNAGFGFVEILLRDYPRPYWTTRAEKIKEYIVNLNYTPKYKATAVKAV